MKGIYITLITIMSVLAIALVSLLGFAIYNGGDFMAFGHVERIEKNIRKDERFSIENIENLEISLISADAYIYTTDEQEIRVVQYSNKELKQDRLYESHLSNQTLSIEGERSKIHFGFFINPSMIYEIFIPKEYSKNINIKTVSGDIMVEDNISNQNLTLKSTSGDIKSTNTLTSTIDIQTVSGDVDLEDVVGTTSIKTTSGDVKASNLEGDINIHTVSGDIRISSLIGGTNIETTSGDIKMNRFELQNASKMKTVSGEVDLTLENTNCEVRTKTTSGDVHLPNGSSLIGDKVDYILEIKTTSGDITIK